MRDAVSRVVIGLTQTSDDGVMSTVFVGAGGVRSLLGTVDGVVNTKPVFIFVRQKILCPIQTRSRVDALITWRPVRGHWNDIRKNTKKCSMKVSSDYGY